MSHNIAIRVKNISKKFIQQDGVDFLALNNISLELNRGEVLGIIGSNGSGKSSLLKILSGIIKPTSGEVEVYGTIASILDIGSGFHPDLSGMENIYLKGKLFGLSTNKIEDTINEIIDFSELNNFIHEPIKNYSNGMFLRLSISIYLNFNTDIYLFDEVLSAGDMSFQKKCFLRLSELLKSGITLVLVSHNIEEIKQFCTRVIYLKEGSVKSDGPVTEVLEDYVENVFFNESLSESVKYNNVNFSPPFTNNIIELNSIYVKAVNKKLGDPILMEDEIEISINYKKILPEIVEFVIFLSPATGPFIICDSSALRNYNISEKIIGDFTELIYIPKNLLNKGVFFISIAITKNHSYKAGNIEVNNAVAFKVNLNEWDKDNVWSKMTGTPLRPMLKWEIINNLTQ